MIKRILVGLGGTPYTPVSIAHAVLLAQEHDAELTGVTVLDPRRMRHLSGPQQHALREISAAGLSHAVEEFETACQAAKIQYQVVAESGDAFTKLVDLSRYHDLIFFGLRSVWDYDFLAGDPDTLLIRLVSAGVRPLIAASQQFRPINRVLIAYNGSMESAKVLKRFVQMRVWPQAELKIVMFHPSETQANELLHSAEAYCRAHNFRVCCEAFPGDPKLLLLTAAELWQADLIVMGSSTRSVLVRKMMGDTLLETLRTTNIPLFLAQ